jgi:hypothetical protein
MDAFVISAQGLLLLICNLPLIFELSQPQQVLPCAPEETNKQDWATLRSILRQNNVAAIQIEPLRDVRPRPPYP